MNLCSDLLVKTDQEKELEKKLLDCENMKQELKSKLAQKNYRSITNLYLNKEASLSRNRQMLKDLEIAKARLRSMASFSPTDQELCDIAAFYQSLLAAEKT